MKKVIVLFLLVSSCLLAQVEYSQETLQHGVTAFYYELAAYKSVQPAKSRIDSYVQVPYSSLSFTKSNNIFQAYYTITLTVFDEQKENILQEKSWKEKLTASSFEETLSRKNFNLSYKSIDLTPGMYAIKIMMEDGNSRRIAVIENKLNVKTFSENIALSDVILISETIKEATQNRIVPNVSNMVTNRDDSLSFFFTLYSNKEQRAQLEFYIHDLQKNTSFQLLTPFVAKKGTNPITNTMKKISLGMGNYSLKILVKDSTLKTVDSTERAFHSGIYGAPHSITDLDKAIAQLVYIASSDEIKFIEDAKEFDERMQRFIKFWDQRNPNPNSDNNPILVEYYRRVAYANKNFKALTEGWKTDMGMIYITFGPPSQVERHPMDSDSKPYEIWYYFELDRSFTFYDDTGFNDYRLYNADYSRWPGYRQ